MSLYGAAAFSRGDRFTIDVLAASVADSVALEACDGITGNN